ncbi:ATP-binding protein [Aphanothece hegewaldii CCALA 016]|uniref:ATP-binding protein n=1 Tax=Aphanothece hegewaldii CCALA 016 TaxID=2107694 RepID=A0A2T1M2Q2_9CHRO|nr:AAA family ATPase [Aphanothece hegewaldii]PSF39012.1 ATP-binding protein [Aphanothece hegewaldii CCALA 016]
MNITELKINSFRGIDDLTLKFNPKKPTVILGVNGVGKSSILDCLSEFFIDFVYEILEIHKNFYNSHKDISKIINNLEKNLMLKRVIIPSIDIKAGNQSSLIQIKSNFRRKDEILNWQIELYKKETINRIILGNLKESVQEQIYSKIIEKTNLFILKCYSVKREVLPDLTQLNSDDDIYIPQIYVYRNLVGGLDFSYFFAWFRLTEDLENEKIRDNSKYRDKKLEAIRTAIYSLIPEFSNLRIRRSPLRMAVNKTVGKTTKELSIEQLSEGEKSLLAMVGDIARRLAIANPILEDPLQGEGVILIDEIELHLHPQWQRKIIPALTRTFPNCQFIITTHSPQVVSHVQPENIYILKSTPEGIKAYKPEASFGRDSNQILEDLMDTPSRPQEIQEQLSDLFLLIADNKLEEAIKLHDTIAEQIGEDEPELIKAVVAIKRKELIGR